jgi:hypothetical protein
MLIASRIFVFSVSAMIQFLVYQWQAGLMLVAEKSSISQVDPVVQAARNLLTSNDFNNLEAFRKLCPDLGNDAASRLDSVRLYRKFLRSSANCVLPNGRGAKWNFVLSTNPPC